MANNVDTAGQALTARGRLATTITAATDTIQYPGTSNNVKRVVRVLVGAGTGAVTIYDSATASGTIVWAISAVTSGAIYELDCPLSNGLTVVVGATTTVTVVYA